VDPDTDPDRVGSETFRRKSGIRIRILKKSFRILNTDHNRYISELGVWGGMDFCSTVLGHLWKSLDSDSQIAPYLLTGWQTSLPGWVSWPRHPRGTSSSCPTSAPLCPRYGISIEEGRAASKRVLLQNVASRNVNVTVTERSCTPRHNIEVTKRKRASHNTSVTFLRFVMFMFTF
jgi:hypothetical protein